MSESAPYSSAPKYKRIVLKLSGEILRGTGTDPLDAEVLSRICDQVKEIYEMGVEVCVVIGGGNIFRGLQGEARGVDRTTGDYMGMLATVINGLAIMDCLEKKGVRTRVQTAIPMDQVAEPFILRRSVRHLEKHRVVIFVAGTGNPYFSTDTTAALRANEVGADIIFKATKVDGIYDKDPKKTRRRGQIRPTHLHRRPAPTSQRHGYHRVLPLPRQRSPHSRFRPQRSARHSHGRPRRKNRHPRTLLRNACSSRHLDGDFNVNLELQLRPSMSHPIVSETDAKMQKALDHTIHEFANIHTGKATPTMVENIMVDAYGSHMRIKDCAAISTPDSRMIVIQPWDKGVLQAVAKGIQIANIGLNPNIDGTKVRVPLPEMSRERRQEFVKVVHRYAENGKVAVRKARHDGLDTLKKAKLPEDESKRLEKEIQALTDKAISSVGEHLASKEKELLEVN